MWDQLKISRWYHRCLFFFISKKNDRQILINGINQIYWILSQQSNCESSIHVSYSLSGIHTKYERKKKLVFRKIFKFGLVVFFSKRPSQYRHNIRDNFFYLFKWIRLVVFVVVCFLLHNFSQDLHKSNKSYVVFVKDRKKNSFRSTKQG